MDLLRLLNDCLRPPSISNCGPEGYVQNLFLIKMECPPDWLTAFAEKSQKDVGAGLKGNISFLAPFEDVRAPS